MASFFLGIDIAKASVEACLISPDGKPKHKHFPNSEAGFAELTSWLKRQFITQSATVHACLEATSHYGDALARFQHTASIRVSVVNPAAVCSFARAELSRNKTDKGDAALLARFCQSQRPPA